MRRRASRLRAATAVLSTVALTVPAVGDGEVRITVVPPNVVLNTNDSGPGSLREAIDFSNSTPGPNTIAFAIPITDPGFDGQRFTIGPLRGYGLSDDATTIDGSTQTVFTGNTDATGPEVVIDGSLANDAPFTTIGFFVPSSDNRIDSLTIKSFEDALHIRGDRNVVARSHILSNRIRGVIIIPGSSTVAARENRIIDSVVAGNTSVGVHLFAADANVIQGSRITGNGDDGIALQSGPPHIVASGVPSNDNLIGGPGAGQGNVISGNARAGVSVREGGSGNVIQGNLIGTDPSGTAAHGNGAGGVHVRGPGNTVGGTTAGARNVLSGNTGQGVDISGSAATGNVVQGNYIGTNASGTAAVPNSSGGVHIGGAGGNTIGGTIAGARNVISGNVGDGVTLSGGGAAANLVQGNYIGTDATGAAALPNTRFSPGGGGGFGIILHHAAGNTIGGTTPGARNVISGNEQAGIQLGDPLQFGGGADVSANLVQGNYVGTDASGTAALGNGTVGVFVFGPGNTIGGTTAGSRNVISGNDTGVGIALGQASGNLVEGNYIGTDAGGAAAIPNQRGATINDAPGNTIGGTAPGARNVISGNGGSGPGTGFGVFIQGDGSTDNLVQGNYIGTDATGSVSLGNAFVGVAVGGVHNLVGGTTPEARNVISGHGNSTNGSHGVSLGGTNNRVQGNYIGTNATGTGAVGNFLGLVVFQATNGLVGGTAPGAGNVISGNTLMGLQIHGPPTIGTRVQGNLIGTNASGTAALGNGGSGVLLFQNATGNTIGGTSSAARNVISGNGTEGVQITDGATGNVLHGNLIGTNASGTAALGNGNSGVLFFGGAAHDNTIGGTGAGAGNTIAFNGGPGVFVGTGTGNALRRNSIFANGLLGIDLAPFGVNPNDPGDADTGPNNLQNFPVLAGAVAGRRQLVVGGHIDTPNPQTVVIEFFANRVPTPGGDPSGHGEGAKFLGTATPRRTGFFAARLPTVPPGTLITATATDSNGNTSEFAKNVAAR